jgi:tetratricopeptide (TPR) repeat protein
MDSDIIQYLITKLEDKIRANPLSPEYVKLANYYLINGNVNEAVELLHAGLNFYPNYITARLILGKAYLANRYFLDAKRVFEQILSENPDMAIARKYLEISADMAKNQVSRKIEEDIIPKLEFKAPEFNDYEYSYNLFPSYEIDDFTRESVNPDEISESNEFTEFRKIFESPHFFRRDSKKPVYEKKRLRNKLEVKVITETLADIFAKQGNYFDAIEAYTYLLKVKPERKEALENKINDVEVQINKLINDF